MNAQIALGHGSKSSDLMPGLRDISIKIVMAFICLFLAIAGIFMFAGTCLGRLFRRSVWPWSLESERQRDTQA